MLTESCVMFFSPSRAVLSAILRDEYLTSAVRTKEGDFSSNYSSRNSTLFSSRRSAWPICFEIQARQRRFGEF